MRTPCCFRQIPVTAFTLSAKAVWMASVLTALKRPGLHILLADSKKSAYFLSSDLYNFFGDDSWTVPA